MTLFANVVPMLVIFTTCTFSAGLCNTGSYYTYYTTSRIRLSAGGITGIVIGIVFIIICCTGCIKMNNKKKTRVRSIVNPSRRLPRNITVNAIGSNKNKNTLYPDGSRPLSRY